MNFLCYGRHRRYKECCINDWTNLNLLAYRELIVHLIAARVVGGHEYHYQYCQRGIDLHVSLP